MKFKKLLWLFILSLLVISGCAKKEEVQTSDPVDVKVAALKGPTAMGLVKFMNDVDEKTVTSNNYQFEILASVDEVAPKIVKGEVNIAAVPANLASVIYNNSNAEVEALAVNTLGVLYICQTGDSVKTVQDLANKTIYASGKGASPEYVLNYILEKNGLEVGKDVNIEWKNEHTEVVSAMAQDENAIAMLPQPFVSVVQAKNENINVALDLTKEWNAIENNSQLITGVVIARKDFIESNPEAVKDFMAKYKESVEYVNANVDDAAKLVGQYDIVPEPIAKKAIPQSNITFITGEQMKNDLSGYLNVLFESNPKSVGGEIPKDDFYYEEK